MTTKPLPDQNVLSNMTIPFFCGLLQSDGCFSLIVEASKTVNAKIALTHTNKDGSWIVAISEWLTKQGVTNSIPSAGSDRWLPENVTSINIMIDRKQAKNLISLIFAEEARLGVPLLFDKKRENILLLKKVLELREINKTLRNDEQKLLNNIKVYGVKKHMTQKRNVSDDALKDRLNISLATEDQLKDAGVEEINAIQQEVKDSGERFLEKMRKDSTSINPEFGKFIAGLIDGDGSVMVSLLSHVKDGVVMPNRNAFEISPQLSLTDSKIGNSHLFNVFSSFFKKDLGYVSQPSTNSKRVVIKDVYTLKTYVVPFLEKTSLTLRKNETRFETFKYVLDRIDSIYRDQKLAESLVSYIYERDLNPEKREKTLNEYLDLVKLEFNKPRKR